MKIDKHMIWMILGCVLPLLFIFLAPALGISSSVSIFIFIAVMFASHLFMPMHSHGGHDNEGQSTDKRTLKSEDHEHNQH